MASILKIDSLAEKTVGHGINLQHSLNNSSGTEILSATGALSGNVDLSGAVFPVGHVIQTKYFQKTDRDAISTSDWTTIPNFSLAITPRYSTSKILITVNIEGSGQSGRYVFSVRLYRDSIDIGLSDQIGTRPQSFISVGAQDWVNYTRARLTNSFLDSPNTTSEIVYSLKVWDTRNNGIVYINRAYYDIDNNYVPTGTSSILLQEIAS